LPRRRVVVLCTLKAFVLDRTAAATMKARREKLEDRDITCIYDDSMKI
jgi:hypothetical protein